MSKKGVSLVSGNISPVVGEKYTYHIADWYRDTPTAERNPAKVTWELFRKRSNGQFTSTHIKKLGDSDFTFGESSLGNTYRLEGYLHKPEGGGLIITPKQSKIPKISKVELLYVDDSKGSTFSFREKLRTKAYCVNMFNKDLIFTLWEDDAKNSGHNESNKPIDTKKARVDENGVAVAEFLLTKALMQKAIQGEIDPKKLEFYVTVEYYKNKKHATENVDVNNPFPQTPKQTPQTPPVSSKQPSKPAAIPKAKGSPAETKPVSKKEEKGIGETITKVGKELWDWWESKGTATKEQEPTVQKPDGKSSAIVKNIPKENKDEDKKICECEARVRAFIRMVRVGEGTGELIKSLKYNKVTKKNDTIYITHDFQKGYTTAFAGNKIADLSTHPQQIFKAKPEDQGSSAAGAYQVMRYTWWELAGFEVVKKKKTGKYFEERDRLKKYKVTDYQPESQDKICIILMEKQRPNLINKIIANKIEDAIQKDGCFIWASLPETNDESHYLYNDKKQSATPLKICIEHYEKFLKEELKGTSPLHLKTGFLEEFDKHCCKESKPENNSTIACGGKKDIDLRNKMTFRAQKTKTDCNLTCRSIMSPLGVVPENPTEKGKESYYQTSIESKDHTKLILNADDFKNGMNYIDKSLEAGYPVMVGVNHTLNYGYNEDTNTSDHYVIIVGRFCDNNVSKYMFWDVATRRGAEGNFKFTLYSDKLHSDKVWKPNRSYTLTQVRRNLDNKGKLIQF